jgi:hypothetical protein
MRILTTNQPSDFSYYVEKSEGVSKQNPYTQSQQSI